MHSFLWGLGLWCCAAFSAAFLLLIVMLVLGSEAMVRHSHCCQCVASGFWVFTSTWLLSSVFLQWFFFFFFGSKSALQDLALGEQIHLVVDSCSLTYKILLTPEEFPLLTKCCCFFSWEGSWGWNLPFFSHPVLHRMLTCQLPREHFNLK